MKPFVTAIVASVLSDPFARELFDECFKEESVKTKEDIKREKREARNAQKSREALAAKNKKTTKVRESIEDRKLLHDWMEINGPKRYVLPNSDLRNLGKNPLLKKIGYNGLLANMAKTIATKRKTNESNIVQQQVSPGSESQGLVGEATDNIGSIDAGDNGAR